MTNVERAFIHQLAQTMGLKSKSDGKGEDRFLTVTKKGMTIISIHINF
jgi:predicted RNA-binding protein Jag